jgi:HAD superfamily hydrolase (TIGR01509 family)
LRRFRYFFFDWDGCLADTLAMWHDIYRELLRRRGIEVDDRTIVRELFNDWAGPARFGIREVEQFAQEVQQGLGARVGEMRLNPHTTETLRELRQRGARCGVLTATRRHLVTPVLERAGILESFDLLLTLDEVPRYKPDPEIVFRALRALDAPAEDAVLVGDSSKDLETAANAGIASVLYFPPANARYYDLEDLRRYGPDHVVRDLRELVVMAPGEGSPREAAAGSAGDGGQDD